MILWLDQRVSGQRVRESVCQLVKLGSTEGGSLEQQVQKIPKTGRNDHEGLIMDEDDVSKSMICPSVSHYYSKQWKTGGENQLFLLSGNHEGWSVLMMAIMMIPMSDDTTEIRKEKPGLGVKVALLFSTVIFTSSNRRSWVRASEGDSAEGSGFTRVMIIIFVPRVVTLDRVASLSYSECGILRRFH